jgi:hypothetical protein
MIKQGDRYPSFLATITSSVAFDLSLATGVKFVWRLAGTPPGARNEGVMTVVDPVAKTVRYDWGAADTLVAGTYQAEIEVTFPVGLVMTFPNVGFIPFVINQTF